MSCAGLWVTPSTARNPMEKRLPVDNSVCGSCLGALGPWLTSVFRLQWIICDEIVSTVKAVAGEFSQCSPALLHQVHLWAGWCLLYWILREKKFKIVMFIVAMMISKYSDGDKMLFQLPLVNINSRRSLSQ